MDAPHAAELAKFEGTCCGRDVTVQVHAEVPEGIPEDRQRIVNENCRTLEFPSFGFEVE